MKKILIFSFAMSLFVTATAQRSYVRKAVKDDIEKKQAEKYEGDRQKGEDAVDERLDKWDENDKKYRAKIEPFPTMSYTMDIENVDNPKNNGSIQYYFKDFECATENNFEKRGNGETRTIMNFKAGTSVILTTDKKGRKTGMEMELKSFDWAIKGAVKKDENMMKNHEASVKETNEYQTIEGYKCRKYLYENEKYRSEIWITNDLKIDYKKFNSSMSSIFSTQPTGNNEYYKAGMKGIMIRTHIFPIDKRMDETIMTMKNFKLGSVDQSKFSTEGYKVEKMPSIRDMWNNYKDEK